MMLPSWLVFGVAFWVLAFGGFRIYLAVTRNRPRRADAPSYRSRGLFARSAKAHAIYGVLYLIFGAYLVASALGYGFTYEGGCRRPESSTSLPVG